MIKTLEEIGADWIRSINDLARAFTEIGETMQNTTFIMTNYSNKSSEWNLLSDSYLGKRGIYRKDGTRIRSRSNP